MTPSHLHNAVFWRGAHWLLTYATWDETTAAHVVPYIVYHRGHAVLPMDSARLAPDIFGQLLRTLREASK